MRTPRRTRRTMSVFYKNFKLNVIIQKSFIYSEFRNTIMLFQIVINLPMVHEVDVLKIKIYKSEREEKKMV